MRLSGILVGVRFSHPLLLITLESLVSQGFWRFLFLKFYIGNQKGNHICK